MAGIQISPVSGLVDEESVRQILNYAFISQGISGHKVEVEKSRYFGATGWEAEEGVFKVRVDRGMGDEWVGVVKGAPNQTLLVRSGRGWDMVRGETIPVGKEGIAKVWGDIKAATGREIFPYSTGIQKFARHIATAFFDYEVQDLEGRTGTMKKSVNELYRESRRGEYRGLDFGVEGRAFAGVSPVPQPFGEQERLTGGYTYISPNESSQAIEFWSQIYSMPILGGRDTATMDEAVRKYEEDVSWRGRAAESRFGALRGSAVWRPDRGAANVILKGAAGTLYGDEGQVSAITDKFLKRSYSHGRRPVGRPMIVGKDRQTMEALPEELLTTASGVLRETLTPQQGIATQAFTSLGALPWQSGQMRVSLPEPIQELVKSRGGTIESGYSAHETVPIGGISSPQHLIKGMLSLKQDWAMGEDRPGKLLQPGVQYQIGTFAEKTLKSGAKTKGTLDISVTQPGVIEAFDLVLPASWGVDEDEIRPYLEDYQKAGVRNIFFAGQEETPYLDIQMQKTGLVGWKGGGAKGQHDMPPIYGAAEFKEAGRGLPIDATKGFVIQEAKDLLPVVYNAMQAMPISGKTGVFNFLQTLYGGREQRAFLRGYEKEWGSTPGQFLNYQYIAQGLGMGFETGEQLMSDIANRAFQRELVGGEWQPRQFSRLDQSWNQKMQRFGWGIVQGQSLVGQYTPETWDLYKRQARIAVERGTPTRESNPLQVEGKSPEEVEELIRQFESNLHRDTEKGVYSLYTDPGHTWMMHPKLENMVYELGGISSDQGNIARALGAQQLGPVLEWFEKHQDRIFQDSKAQVALKDIVMANLATQNRRYPAEQMPLTVKRGSLPGSGLIDPESFLQDWLGDISSARAEGRAVTDVEKMELFEETLRNQARIAGAEYPEGGAPIYFEDLGATLAKPSSFLGIEKLMYQMRPAPGEPGHEEWMELGMETATKSSTAMLNTITKLFRAEADPGQGAGPLAVDRLTNFYEKFAYSDQLRKRRGGIFTHYAGTGLVKPGEMFLTRRAEERLFHSMGGEGPTRKEWYFNKATGEKERTSWGEFRYKLARSHAIGARPPYPNIGSEEYPGSYQPLRILTEKTPSKFSPTVRLMREAMRQFQKEGVEPAEVWMNQGYIANLGDLDIDPYMLLPLMYAKGGGRWSDPFTPSGDYDTDFAKRVFESGTPEAQLNTFNAIFGRMAKYYDPFSSQIASYLEEIGGEPAMKLLQQQLASDIDIQPQTRAYNIAKQRQMGTTYNTYVRRFRVEAGMLGIPESVASEMGDMLTKYYQYAVDFESQPTSYEQWVGTAGFFGDDMGRGIQLGARIGDSFSTIGATWNPARNTKSLINMIASQTARQIGHATAGREDMISGKAMAALFGNFGDLPEDEQRAAWLQLASEWEAGFEGTKPTDYEHTAGMMVRKFTEQGKFSFFSPGVQSVLSRAIEYQTDPMHPERMDLIKENQKFMWGEPGQEEALNWQEFVLAKAPAIGAYQFAKAKKRIDRQDFYRDPWVALHSFVTAQEQGTAKSSAIQDWWNVIGRGLGIKNPAETQGVEYQDPRGQKISVKTHEDIENLRNLFTEYTTQQLARDTTGMTLARYEPANYMNLAQPGTQPRKWHMTEMAHAGALLEGKPTHFSRDVMMSAVGRIFSQAIPGLRSLRGGLFNMDRQMAKGVELERAAQGTLFGAGTAKLPRAEGMGVYLTDPNAPDIGGHLLMGMPDYFRVDKDVATGRDIAEIGDIKLSEPEQEKKTAYWKQTQGYVEQLLYAQQHQGGMVYRHKINRGDQSAFDKFVADWEAGRIDEASLSLEQVPIREYIKDVTRFSTQDPTTGEFVEWPDLDRFMTALEQGDIRGAMYYAEQVPGAPKGTYAFKHERIDPTGVFPTGGLFEQMQRVTGYLGGEYNIIGTRIQELAVSQPEKFKEGVAEAIRNNERAIHRLYGQFPAQNAPHIMPPGLPMGYGMSNQGIRRMPYDMPFFTQEEINQMKVMATAVTGQAPTPNPQVQMTDEGVTVRFSGQEGYGEGVGGTGGDEEYLNMYDPQGNLTGRVGMKSTLGRNVVDFIGGRGRGFSMTGAAGRGVPEEAFNIPEGGTGLAGLGKSDLQFLAKVLGQIEGLGTDAVSRYFSGGFKSTDVLSAETKLLTGMLRGELGGRTPSGVFAGGVAVENRYGNLVQTPGILAQSGQMLAGEALGYMNYKGREASLELFQERFGDVEGQEIWDVLQNENDPLKVFETVKDLETSRGGQRIGGLLAKGNAWKQISGSFRNLRILSTAVLSNLANVPQEQLTEMENVLADLGFSGLPYEVLHAIHGGEAPPEGEDEALSSIRRQGASVTTLSKIFRNMQPDKDYPLSPEMKVLERGIFGARAYELEGIDKTLENLSKFNDKIITLSGALEEVEGKTDKWSLRVQKTAKDLSDAERKREQAGYALGLEYPQEGLFQGRRLSRDEMDTLWEATADSETGRAAADKYVNLVEAEQKKRRTFLEAYRKEDEEGVGEVARARAQSSFFRRALGGFGLMYMKSIAGIMASPAMFGYQEAEQQQQAAMGILGPLVGGYAPSRTQETEIQNAMAAYGGGGWMGMRRAYADMLRRQPGAATLLQAGVAGVGAMGATATMGLWTGMEALGSMSVLGPVGILGALAGIGMIGYGANIDNEGSAIQLAGMMREGRASISGGNINVVNPLDAFSKMSLGFNLPRIISGIGELGSPGKGIDKLFENAGWLQDLLANNEKMLEIAPVIEKMREYSQGGGTSLKDFLRGEGISEAQIPEYMSRYMQYLPTLPEFKGIPAAPLMQAQMLQEFTGEALSPDQMSRLSWALTEGVDVTGALGAVSQGAGGTLEDQRRLFGELLNQYTQPGQALTLEEVETLKLGGARAGQLGERIGRRLGGTPLERTWSYAGLKEYEWEDYTRRVGLLEGQYRTMGYEYEMPTPESYTGMTEEQMRQRQVEDMRLQQTIQYRSGVQAGFMQFGITPNMQQYRDMTNMQLQQIQSQQQFGWGFGQQMLMGGATPERANQIGASFGFMAPPDFRRFSQMLSGNQFEMAAYATQNPFNFFAATQGLTGLGGQAIAPGALVQVDIAEVGGQPIGPTGMAWGTSGFGNFNNGVWQSSAGFVDQIMGGMGGTAPEGFRTAAIAGQHGIALWQLQQQAEYQAGTAGIQMAQIALQEKYQPMFWDVQDRMRDSQRAQSMWQLGFQERQMQAQAGFWMQNYGINLRQQEMQRGWAREDWAFQDQTRAMQWGWRVEDFEEQRRFMTGRERRMAERQMGRETIMHDLEGEQIDRQRERQQELWAIEDERMLLQLQQQQTSLEFQEEQLQKTREYYEETWALQDEQTELSRDYWREQIELQKQSAGMAAQYAKDMQFVAEFMEKSRQEAEKIGGQKSLLDPEFWTEFGDKLAEIDPLFNEALVKATENMTANLADLQPLYSSYVTDTIKMNETIKELNPAMAEFTGYFEQMYSAVDADGGGRLRKPPSPPRQGKQFGGTVIGGEEYFMGEDGPEVYRPYASGVVTPNYKTDPWQNQTWVMDWTPMNQQPVTIIVKIGEEEIKHRVIEFVSQEIE